jgi:hypothetical protein
VALAQPVVRLVRLVQILLARDPLPLLPARRGGPRTAKAPSALEGRPVATDSGRSTSSPSLLRALFASEELPLEPERPTRARQRGSRSLLSALFASEELPAEPVRPRRARAAPSLLRSLFAHEGLKEEEERPRRMRPTTLGWLFAREELDDDGPGPEVH